MTDWSDVCLTGGEDQPTPWFHADRLTLHRLAREHGEGKHLCQAVTAPPERTVCPGLRALLQSLEPEPAVLLDRMGDIVA